MSLITYNRPKKAVILDVDGVLLPCAELGIKRWNAEHASEEPMRLTEITRYGYTGTRTDDLIEYYQDEKFYHAQKPYPGAVEFVNELCKTLDVYFLTAVPGNVVEYRQKQLKRFFPNVPASNIFFGSVKERFIADFSLDDSPDHILAQFDSGAVKYPVIMRRPWNEHLSGIMSVNGYEDFIEFIRIVGEIGREKHEKNPPYIFALVGPAGSNKGALCDALIKQGFVRLPSYTTSVKKEDEPEGYTHVSTDEFLKMREEGLFIETTSYAENYYGMPEKNVKEILDNGKHAVTVVDVCGAVVLKRLYGERCFTVYVERDYEAVLADLTEKHTGAQLVSRLRWLSAEKNNRNLCELIVDNTDVEAAALALSEFAITDNV